jgi:hypothetical protein
VPIRCAHGGGWGGGGFRGGGWRGGGYGWRGPAYGAIGLGVGPRLAGAYGGWRYPYGYGYGYPGYAAYDDGGLVPNQASGLDELWMAAPLGEARAYSGDAFVVKPGRGDYRGDVRRYRKGRSTSPFRFSRRQ